MKIASLSWRRAVNEDSLIKVIKFENYLEKKLKDEGVWSIVSLLELLLQFRLSSYLYQSLFRQQFFETLKVSFKM